MRTRLTLIVAALLLVAYVVDTDAQRRRRWGRPSGNTINAASCSQADVQTAANAAADGDRVVIPTTGSPCTWTTAVIVGDGLSGHGSPRNVSFVGPGCTLSGGLPTSCSLTIINNITAGSGDARGIIVIYTAVGSKDNIEITGFELEGQDSAGTQPSLRMRGTGQNWRIHHILVDSPRGVSISTADATYGLIDHNQFNLNHAGGAVVVSMTAATWAGGTSGNGSASAALDLGARAAVYIEDNDFTSTVIGSTTDCDNGGRYVFRHNTITGLTVQTHGTEGQNLRGCVKVEGYSNTLTSALSGQSIFHNRGGNGVFFNNVADGTYHFRIAFAHYRTDRGYYIYNTAVGSEYSWGKCTGITASDDVGFHDAETDGTAANEFRSEFDSNDGMTYDSGTHTGSTSAVLTDSMQSWSTNEWIGYSVFNTDTGRSSIIVSNTATTITLKADHVGNQTTPEFTSGDAYVILRAYPCLDQVGWAGGELLSGNTPTPTGWPTQVLTPFYVWGNTIDAAAHDGLWSAMTQTPAVWEGRDFYNQAGGFYDTAGYPKSVGVTSNECSAWDGTCGVGVGVLASLPATCTTGVAYFATDQGDDGKLYKCTATNTWTIYYTPFEYPHPRQAS